VQLTRPHWFWLATIVLLVAIVVIAVFFEGGFIRNHFGDILIVLLIYCFIRCFTRRRIRFLWLYIFAFAVLVEVMQYVGLVYLLGLGDSQLARVVIGVTFDGWDMVMYFIGCVMVGLVEWKIHRNGASAHDTTDDKK